MIVKDLEQLPEVTDHVLSGLQADESLKHRIYQKAAGVTDVPERKISRIPLIALCAISAVMIGVFVLLGNVAPLSSSSPDARDSVQIQTISAGVTLTESPVSESTQDEDTEEDNPDEETEQEKGSDETDPEQVLP